jgi:hypothetical protein
VRTAHSDFEQPSIHYSYYVSKRPISIGYQSVWTLVNSKTANKRTARDRAITCSSFCLIDTSKQNKTSSSIKPGRNPHEKLLSHELRVQGSKLYGRDKELAIFEQAFEFVSQPQEKGGLQRIIYILSMVVLPNEHNH